MRNSTLELSSLGDALSEKRFPLAYEEEQQLELTLRPASFEKKADISFWYLVGRAAEARALWVHNLPNLATVQVAPSIRTIIVTGETSVISWFIPTRETVNSSEPELVASIALSSLFSDRPSSTGFRSRELEWRRANPEALKAIAGQWVVLEGEEIIAHGHDLLQVDAEARARGIKIPYLFYVEAADENVVQIGL